MDVEVVIEGLTDLRVANEIKRQVRQVCKDTERPGRWSLTVFPSETRGQWDLGVRGPFGRHFASFTEQVDQLPGLIAAQLRAACNDSARRTLFSLRQRPAAAMAAGESSAAVSRTIDGMK